ncbi:MAG: thermonuclease family protein [Kaistella sp.]
MMRKRFLILCALFFYGFVFSQKIAAKVVGVKDGDTFVVLHGKKEIVVRLEHIDAPEKNQPYGARAKQFASGFCFGKTVVVMGNGKKDRNGRWIGEIFYNNQNLGKELVRNGLAWHYKRYSKSANYADLEMAARKKNKGLWQDKNPVAPWNWRKFRKKKV